MRTVEGSCWPCKDRRVLCDLQRPRCSRCVASGQPCGYGRVRLRWCNGVAARGRLAGQNIPVSAASSTAGVVRVDPGAALLSPLSPLSAPADQPLLYFQYEIVDRFNLSPDLLLVDLHSVTRDPALLQCVTAVANAHRLFFMTRGSLEDAALAKKRARLEAIKLFRKQLLAQTPVVDGQTGSMVTDLFVTNVLLCILDGVIDPDDEGAATYCHFRGGRAILSQWHFLDRLFQTKRGLSALMLSVFATMDLTYALLSGQKPYFPGSMWMNFAGCEAWWGTLPRGDPFLEIMSILSDLALLGHQARESGQALSLHDLLPIQTALEQNGRRTSLEVLHEPSTSSSSSSPSSSSSTSLPPSPPLSSPSSTADETESLDYETSWGIFCSAYRFTAQIYMYRALCNLEVTHPLVQQATAEGVRAISSGSRLAGKLSHCLLFPTLVVGSHCLEETQRRAIRASFTATEAFLRFGSVRVMEGFLRGVWDGSNADWWSCFDTIARRAFLF